MAAYNDPSMFSEQVITYTPIVISFAAFCVSLVVAAIGIRQWKTSAEKLRLDLYDRRFAIYEAAVAFYRARYKNENRELTEEDVTNMVLAVRESRFLFDPEDGVTDALNQFRELVQSKHYKDSNGLEAILISLENAMGKYLNFHNIR